MNTVFNTSFEVSLRVLIILNISRKRLSIERITSIDFISTYGKDFEVSEYNLHGNNSYRFSEYASRRKFVSKALKELVLKEYITPYCDNNGFNYSISKTGISFCESLNDEYAQELSNIVKKAIHRFSEYSDMQLIHFINEHALSMFGGMWKWVFILKK